MISGVLLVDKPGGITSHDVVARARRSLGTRKVGHAGTLDPMATGLLVLGVGPATRLLTYFVGLDKTYEATIRLGQVTTTDDAEGEIVATADPAIIAAVTDTAIAEGVAALTGDIEQRPSSVSAIRVDGRRAYERVRDGEEVELPTRAVTVRRFEVSSIRRVAAAAGTGVEAIEFDAVIDCTSGTYIRALARDLGAALGVGGHLTALRRTHVGPFAVAEAIEFEGTRDDPAVAAALITPAAAAAAVLPAFPVTVQEAVELRQGRRIARDDRPRGVVAAIDPLGELVGVVKAGRDEVRVLANLPHEAPARNRSEEDPA